MAIMCCISGFASLRSIMLIFPGCTSSEGMVGVAENILVFSRNSSMDMRFHFDCDLLTLTSSIMSRRVYSLPSRFFSAEYRTPFCPEDTFVGSIWKISSAICGPCSCSLWA